MSASLPWVPLEVPKPARGQEEESDASHGVRAFPHLLKQKEKSPLHFLSYGIPAGETGTLIFPFCSLPL